MQSTISASQFQTLCNLSWPRRHPCLSLLPNGHPPCNLTVLGQLGLSPAGEKPYKRAAAVLSDPNVPSHLLRGCKQGPAPCSVHTCRASWLAVWQTSKALGTCLPRKIHKQNLPGCEEFYDNWQLAVQDFAERALCQEWYRP